MIGTLALWLALAAAPRVETLPASRGGQDRVGQVLPPLAFDRWLKLADGVAPTTKGRVTLYRWWTDGCEYCRASLPAIERLRREHASAGLVVVGVYHPKPPRPVDDALVLRAARRSGFDGAVAVDEDWSELERAYLSHATREATSVTLLVDADGVIRFVHPGPVLFPSGDPRHARENADYRMLEKAVVTLLAGPR